MIGNKLKGLTILNDTKNPTQYINGNIPTNKNMFNVNFFLSYSFIQIVFDRRKKFATVFTSIVYKQRKLIHVNTKICSFLILPDMNEKQYYKNSPQVMSYS